MIDLAKLLCAKNEKKNLTVLGVVSCCMWDGCNSEVAKAIIPSFKDYEENQRNETAIKFGALNPAVNKPGEKYTTHRMGEDFFGVLADEHRWFYVTKSVPKHHTRRVGFICSSSISFFTPFGSLLVLEAKGPSVRKES